MFSQISSLKVKIFEKLKHGFVDEKALITTTSLSSCHLKTLVPFCWQKKRPQIAKSYWKTNYEIQNHSEYAI